MTEIIVQTDTPNTPPAPQIAGAQKAASHPPKIREVNFGERFMRRVLIIVLGVYAAFVLGVLALIALDRLRVVSTPVQALTTEDKAALALDQADRILSLLEVVLGMIAVILPLALGVVVYIFQQNRRTIEQLTYKAEAAETNAGRSAERVREYRDEALKIDYQVRDTLSKIAEAEARDIERDKAAKILQDQIRAQSGEVEELRLNAEQLLSQSRNAQGQLKQIDQFLQVRRLSVLCTSENVIDSVNAVTALLQIARYPEPEDEDGEGRADPQRADRDMLLRREALRALMSVSEARNMPAEITAELLAALKKICDGDEHQVLALEARRTLSELERTETPKRGNGRPSGRSGARKNGTPPTDGDVN